MGAWGTGRVRTRAVRGVGLAAVAVVAAGVIGPVDATSAGATSAGATGPATVRPGSVFDVSAPLAIAAAHARLALFVESHPLAEPAVEQPAPTAACPLASPETLTSLAGAGFSMQTEPWVAATASSPELRPDTAPSGVVQGIPVVRCTTSRPADGAITRPELFAISLTGGVSFGDVARLHAIDPVLRVAPAGIGGEMAGACLDTADTATCVVLWQSRNLLTGVTLEGPPSGVSTGTAGALLTRLVPGVVDTLAVVQRAPLPCTAEALVAATGVSLLAEPTCHDGWAVGVSVQCPPPPADPTTTTTTVPPCEALRDVFHVEADGWKHDGSIDGRCAETLAALGMTGVTAQQFTAACDPGAPALGGGTIRPDAAGARVAALQVALVNLGYDLPVDGRYGALTEAAVVDFQVDNGLIVDGITGQQTQTALGI